MVNHGVVERDAVNHVLVGIFKKSEGDGADGPSSSGVLELILMVKTGGWKVGT